MDGFLKGIAEALISPPFWIGALFFISPLAAIGLGIMYLAYCVQEANS